MRSLASPRLGTPGTDDSLSLYFFLSIFSLSLFILSLCFSISLFISFSLFFRTNCLLRPGVCLVVYLFLCLSLFLSLYHVLLTNCLLRPGVCLVVVLPDHDLRLEQLSVVGLAVEDTLVTHVSVKSEIIQKYSTIYHFKLISPFNKLTCFSILFFIFLDGNRNRVKIDSIAVLQQPTYLVCQNAVFLPKHNILTFCFFSSFSLTILSVFAIVERPRLNPK